MNHLRLLAGLLAFLSLSSIASCEDDEPESATTPTVQVSYAQTQCGDRWGQAATPQQLEAVVTAYLQQQGIVASDVQAARTGSAVVCAACTCPTGVVLKANVRPADLQAVLNLGFRQI